MNLFDKWFKVNFGLGFKLTIALLLVCSLPLQIVQAGTHASQALTNKEVQQIFQRGWWLLSQIQTNKAGLDEALELYSKVAASNPRNRDVYWKLAEITFKKSEATENEDERENLYKQALHHARQALELNPDSVEAHFWVGSSSAKLAELVGTFSALSVIKEAIKELKLTHEMDQDHRYAGFAAAALAAIYSQAPWPLKDIDAAIMYAEEAVKRAPNLSLACATMASVYLKGKKIEAARLEAERCLALSPPDYIWDAELYNWPWARRILQEIDKR